VARVGTEYFVNLVASLCQFLAVPFAERGPHGDRLEALPTFLVVRLSPLRHELWINGEVVDQVCRLDAVAHLGRSGLVVPRQKELQRRGGGVEETYPEKLDSQLVLLIGRVASGKVVERVHGALKRLCMKQ
jgi:hypothetical protein